MESLEDDPLLKYVLSGQDLVLYNLVLSTNYADLCIHKVKIRLSAPSLLQISGLHLPA